MAKKIGGLDIGQTVVVKNKAIMAVEAIEGTDKCILRGGALGKNVIVAKTAKPAQDNRFDMPSVGVATIEAMQSSIDAAYIAHLGAEKRKIYVTGNTKFDQTYAAVTPEDLIRYKEELGLMDAYPVLVGGSTHPTEEAALFNSFNVIRKEFPKARIVIAPRKPGRTEEIVKLAKQYGLETGLRSKLLKDPSPRVQYPVIIIDTIGELGRIYAVGDAVFVGGTLIKHGYGR